MKLDLHRKWRKKGYSIGVLCIDGQRICETLEDEDRGLHADMSLSDIKAHKIKGETAIPTGTYRITCTYSPRFKKNLPLLNSVPGYDGVRIHSGNKAKDTEGCILCGRNTEVATVTNSRYWTDKVISSIDRALKDNEEVTISIHY